VAFLQHPPEKCLTAVLFRCTHDCKATLNSQVCGSSTWFVEYKPLATKQRGSLMKFLIVMASLATLDAAFAADLPHPQPPPPAPVVGKAPIGKAPIGKAPIGKAPAPVVTKG
jgi:hypothetical protein